ncbi:MAG TPA: hypothetical protein VF647_23355 [Longimicrobium sp.]|jgi:hypothetical protein
MSDQDTLVNVPAPDAAAEPVPPSDSGGQAAMGDGPLPGASKGESAFRQANETGDIEADNVSFSTIENQIVHMYRSRTALRDFTCADAQPVSESWEETSVWSYEDASEAIDGLVRHLEDQRVLLLDATRGAGRVTASIYVGRRLRERGSCDKPTLLVQSLDRQVRLDLRRVAVADREMRNRMVIFRDTLSRVDKTDHSGWQQLKEQLRERNAYVVFITESGEAARDDLAPTRPFVRALPRHSRERLEAELEARLREMGRQGGDVAEIAAALDARRDWLLGNFTYAPQIAEFVSLYAELNRPALEPEEVWARFCDTGGRLLRNPDGDLDGWSAVLALAVSQCLRDARGVRWVDFDRLHRHVRDWLRADLELRTPRTVEDEGGRVPAVPVEFSDEPLLAAAHAEDYVDPATLACMVRFRGGVPPEEVWQALLQRHRRALGTLLPGLRQLAEEGGDLAVLAAQVIGRIGELDPERIVFPLVSRWMASDHDGLQGAVGALYEGVLGSGSEPYQKLCLHHLHELRCSPAAAGVRLPAIIAAYSWIGDFEPAHAMRELGAMAREHLAPMIADVQRLGRLMARVAQKRGQQRSATARAVLQSYQSMLRDLVTRVYAEKASTYVAIQMTVASLIATRGLRVVLGELRRWVAEGGWQMGVLVAMMFLNEKGIADRLKKPRGDAGAAGGCNAMVTWMSEGEHEVRLAARFLEDLFDSLATPFLVETELQRHCAASLREHLTDWVHSALPNPDHAAAMKSLLEKMARMPALRESLLDLLEAQEFAEGDLKVRKFVSTIHL